MRIVYLPSIKGFFILSTLAMPWSTTLATDEDRYVSETIAATTTSTISEIKKQLELLQLRLEMLETAAEAAAPSSKPIVKSDPTKYIADLRYRHEAFSIENKPTRHRHRIRARFATTKPIDDTIAVTFGLASGSSDPISTNQTLGNGNSSKNVVLDLAYAQWQTPFNGLSVRAGKFSNPLMRVGGSGLVWDGDLRPEGLGFSYKHENMFFNAMGSWLRESSSTEDSILYAAQLGSQRAIGLDQSLRFGLGYYTITAPTPLFSEPAGNRVTADNELLSDFNSAEIFAEYARPMDGLISGNALLFASHVSNLGANDADSGYVLGAKLKSSRLDLGWSYQRLEADAVFGGLSDSDFIGGGTDGSGHIFQAGYPLSKKVKLQGTLFINQTGLESNAEDSYNRLMLDISYKY